MFERARYKIAALMPPIDGDQARAVLFAVGGLLSREVALDELLDRMVRRIALALEADRGTIYLVDGGTGEVFSRAAELPEIEEIRLKLGQGIAGHVAQSGQVVNVPTTNSEVRFFPGVDKKTGYQTRSILAVPMRDRQGQIIGVVQLLNKQGGVFPQEDETLLSELSEQAALVVEATSLYADLARPPGPELSPFSLKSQFNGIVGSSGELRTACRLTEKAAASEATVLVRGESGTGKELFARAIHVNSGRSEGPFVKVDCAALPETLIENELFGHERGAYTGADKRASGKFDAARGGTLFLDEIGELPLAVQGKLLGVIQDRCFQRVGGQESVDTDVRLVAATNRNLEEMVQEGRFRGDLYFRIKVVELKLPPLRTRGPADIRRLATHFAQTATRRHGRPPTQLSAEALVRLENYPWPGNVRELENCIESAVVVMEGAQIQALDLPLPEQPLGLVSSTETRATATPAGQEPEHILPLEEIEKAHILRALKAAQGNRSQAAKLLGIGRNTMTRKLKSYGLQETN